MIRSALDQPPAAAAGSPRRDYGGVFWLCYLANAMLTVAVSVLFRYADFVRDAGGGEAQLGLIVGAGMVGALSMRVVQAIGIDRYGARRVWLISLAGFIISALLHIPVTRVDTPWVYAVRILMTTSIAGSFGASLTYISLRVPAERMAEMIGMLGTSGFIGIAIGPALADFLFSGEALSREPVNRMFLLAALAGTMSLIMASIATRGSAGQSARRRPPVVWLVRRYHPGMLLLVAAGVGLGICLPHEFLRAFAAERGITQIKTFFIVYAATAFCVRVATRQMTQRLGTRTVIMLGSSALCLSMLLYPLVWHPWHMAFPALMAGTAHALLFPAVVAGGSVSFPARYRGLATTLTLAMFDVGNLVGKPAIGLLIAACHRAGLPAYPVMFASVAATIGLLAAIYAAGTRRLHSQPPLPADTVPPPMDPVAAGGGACYEPLEACNER